MDGQGSHAPLKPTLGLRYTTVQAAGAYMENIAGLSYQPTPLVQMGIQLPLVHTQQTESKTTGLGNIVAFVEGFVLPSSKTQSLSVGLQLEMPTVSQPALGDGHFLLLPTVQGAWMPDNKLVMATFGWSQVLDGEHNHSADETHGHDDHSNHDEHHAEGTHGDDVHGASSPDSTTRKSFVNPHSSSEILFRVDMGHRWKTVKRTIRLSARLDGIQEMEPGTQRATILNLGPALGWTNGTAASEIYTLLPVTENRRFHSRIGFRLRLAIP